MLASLGASSWVYPVLEIAHLFGIALLLGNLVLLEARVFGFGPALEVPALARLSLTPGARTASGRSSSRR